MRHKTLLFIAQLTALLFATASPVTAQEQVLASATNDNPAATADGATSGAFSGNKLMYTTYFYTATEAIVHGYAEDTNVRIVSLAENRTIWKGVVGPGDTKLVPTGSGVFGFLSDKKASILVGTPSSCTVVGYWLRDENGTFVADHFYGRIPTSGSADDRVVVWAWDDITVQITDVAEKTTVMTKTLEKGGRLVLDKQDLRTLGGRVIEFSADKQKMAVQVYQDEGFFVPGPDGRTAGRHFRSYVGKTTEGVNDLNLIAYHQKAKVNVRDLDTDEIIWKGTIRPGDVHTLTLSGKFVDITSDVEISALVAPYEHYRGGYAEHHYGAGVEGTGIETEFLLTTPDELWLFSYYDGNHVEVIDEKTNKTVWEGELGAGHVQGVNPGYGYYRVKSNAGISVMGGDQACGAEYSPAAGLFRVDEELLKVATVILKEREEAARAQGRSLSKDEREAPLSAEENRKARRYIKENLGRSVTADEVNQRMESMQTY